MNEFFDPIICSYKFRIKSNKTKYFSKKSRKINEKDIIFFKSRKINEKRKIIIIYKNLIKTIIKIKEIYTKI